MAWPKGKPRKPVADATPAAAPAATLTPIQQMQQRIAEEKAAEAAKPKRPMMKAKPNWEEYDPEDQSQDRLSIPPELFPEGFDFQWITDSVLGQAFPRIRADFERKGWTPVHQQDFDGILDGKFMPKGMDGPIEVDGLVLMARPLELSIRAKKMDHQRAREAVLIKQQQLTGGDMPGVSLDSRHPSAVNSNRINRTIEPITIPSDGE